MRFNDLIVDREVVDLHRQERWAGHSQPTVPHVPDYLRMMLRFRMVRTL